MAGDGPQHGVLGPHELGYAVHDLAVQSASAGLLVACSSFIPEAQNFVDVLSVSFDAPRQGVRGSVRLPHYYPPTRVRWLGAGSPGQELLATSGDCIRVWSASGELRRLLRHDSNPQKRCTPITSVDATPATPSSASASQLASCDIYGICSLWDMETGSVKQAFDLGQPLCDVAFGPNGLVAVAGDQGECFLLDPRQPQGDVSVFAPRERVHGPGRIAWGAHRPDMFAIAWQGEEGALAIYDASPQKAVPRVLKSPSSAVTSDLQWSYAHAQLLACAKEDGQVEIWQFPEVGVEAAAMAAGPGYTWAPRRRGANCTALAMSPEVRSGGHHVLVLATMPAGQPGPQGQEAAATGGALWFAGLPPPVRSSGATGEATGAGSETAAGFARGDGPVAALGTQGGFGFGGVSTTILSR